MKKNVLKRFKYTDEQVIKMRDKFLHQDNNWFYELYFKATRPNERKKK
jgi:hypothetical protein